MVLVTGGSGLVGSELITALLSCGKQVRAIYNKTKLPHAHHPALEQVKCNVLDVIALEEAMAGVEEVYNCAGFVSFSSRDKETLYKINIEGTANVVNAALDAGVKKMVHISSVAALGRIREDKPVDETMQWTEETSNSIYGHSKYMGEMEVWRGIAEGLNAVIVNPSIIFGPGDWSSGSSQIFKNVYDEFGWYTLGSSGFVDVRDVVKAMRMLMESDISGEKFIISGENATYKEVFDMMADAFGKRRPSKKVTPLIAAIVWRLEALKSRITGSNPLITKETATTSLAKVTFDNRKLLEALPHFSYTPLKETIQWTVGALQQKLNK